MSTCATRYPNSGPPPATRSTCRKMSVAGDVKEGRVHADCFVKWGGGGEGG